MAAVRLRRFRLDKSRVPEYRFCVSSIAIAPPLISVCIATYNGAAYLSAQLDSVLNQTHRHLEILIGDDTSSDVTREILEAYAQRDGRIRLIFNPENLGYNRNFEALARQATGEYIAFCDQDDVCKKIYSSSYKKNLNNHSNYFYCAASFQASVII
ncbi:MAG: glycosyltransferase [Holosporales bacterium]